MTTREIYNTMHAYLNGADVDTAELSTEIEAALQKMDAQNAARKVKAAEKAAESQAAKEPLRTALYNVMGDAENPMTASMLIDAARVDVKPASVPSLMRPLVEQGLVLKVDMKITGKGTQRGYVRA